MIKFAVDDEEEVQYSQWIMRLFSRTEEIDAALERRLEPLEGSALSLDDIRCPHYPVSGYAVGQLSVAMGCIASLKLMMVHESDGKFHMVASPFGAYALVRNALDSAAAALWLLEPVNGTLRIKRRIQLGVDEVGKSAALRETMGQPSVKAQRRARMQEVAELAGLAGWNPLSKNEGLPTMTKMLKDLERLHSNVVFPWLAAWQLASGHAHGKVWAQTSTNELQEIEGTRTATGAQFQMTIRYGMLAALLLEAIQLLETAGARYIELSGGH
ncbi:hypothetical protein NG697_12695 [Pseudarthrobacter sp. MDT3-26]|uniref:hypothetical protein n=1 Tax=Pseudarthrobacter raffinosi TaxID=2953651 RepID=UPI00208DF92E|nr:hypothetical protein [Pseudarthrobacter sp. MDT3-26]MCO4263770.1 hypothetical protein [Pseudarthrobacter sp. MDT3-26]